jgi:hypothetical protein
MIKKKSLRLKLRLVTEIILLSKKIKFDPIIYFIFRIDDYKKSNSNTFVS